MFSDGNGRTSRFIYDLISGELKEENLAYYFHKDSNKTLEENNNLEEIKEIMDISLVNKIPDELILGDLNFLPDEILSMYNWITVGHTDYSPSTDKILPENVVNDLSENELKNLDLILRDGYGVKYCPSGIAMLYVIHKKGLMNKWIDYVHQDEGAIPGRFNVSIYRHPERISDWTADEFREVIRAGNVIKYDRLKSIIDVFIYPEKYKNIETGKAYAEEILNYKKEIENDDQLFR